MQSQGVAAREMEKLNRYCRIELKGERTVLNTKEIELHAWAAGVIPENISGITPAAHVRLISLVFSSIAFKLRCGSSG